LRRRKHLYKKDHSPWRQKFLSTAKLRSPELGGRIVTYPGDVRYLDSSGLETLIGLKASAMK